MNDRSTLERREFLKTTAVGLMAGSAAGLLTGNLALGQNSPAPPSPTQDQGESSGFNPLAEKGMPLEQQARTWRELTELEYDKQTVHPYTRCRIITMNGIEVAAAIFKHNMARHFDNPIVRERLALTRRIEQQQQKRVNGLVPANEHTLETTIGYEQVAVDLTAWLAQNEPDPHVKAALDFALLEDFDHLYRYANVLDMRRNGYMRPEMIVGRLTEIMPGRPTPVEHCHPLDSVRRWVDFSKASPQTLMNIMTIVAAEKQTMNFYMNVQNRAEDKVLRGLYNEIGLIEEQHVTHYESLMDPTCPLLKCAVMHELHECYMYYSFAEQEVDPVVKRLWEVNLDMEIGHLHDAVAMYKDFAKKDPAEFLPSSLPKPILFQSNIDYVRQILAEQVALTTKHTEYVNVAELPQDYRYFAWRSSVNGDWVPAGVAISNHIAQQGEDYRFAVAEHPVPAYRDRTSPSVDYPQQA